jgi:thiopeptide-type bacteriocin biosynthesis protein
VLDLLDATAPAPVCSGAPTWLQINVTLFAQDRQGSPYVPWHDLSANVNTWRNDGRFEQWFFMRKPPGLRLRFRGPDLDQRLMPVLVPWLEEAEHRNAIRSFRPALYEPESFRFGGQAGMAIAHDQFDRDSCLVLRYETLSADDRTTLQREVFSLAVMNGLFQRCVGDGAEVWDIWQQLRHALSGPAERPLDAGSLAWEHRLLAGESLDTALLSSGAQTLLGSVYDHNREVAARLHVAQVSQQMTIGPRAWLVAVCIFHWNRLGFTLTEVGPIAERMVRHLDPTGETDRR